MHAMPAAPYKARSIGNPGGSYVARKPKTQNAATARRTRLTTARAIIAIVFTHAYQGNHPCKPCGKGQPVAWLRSETRLASEPESVKYRCSIDRPKIHVFSWPPFAFARAPRISHDWSSTLCESSRGVAGARITPRRRSGFQRYRLAQCVFTQPAWSDPVAKSIACGASQGQSKSCREQSLCSYRFKSRARGVRRLCLSAALHI